jgi:hypothetical protein
MKNQTSHTIKNLFVVVLLLLTGYVQANPPGFEDDVPDNPVAPIDSWIAPMFVVAVLLLYYYNKRIKCSSE